MGIQFFAKEQGSLCRKRGRQPSRRSFSLIGFDNVLATQLMLRWHTFKACLLVSQLGLICLRNIGYHHGSINIGVQLFHWFAFYSHPEAGCMWERHCQTNRSPCRKQLRPSELQERQGDQKQTAEDGQTDKQTTSTQQTRQTNKTKHAGACIPTPTCSLSLISPSMSLGKEEKDRNIIAAIDDEMRACRILIHLSNNPGATGTVSRRLSATSTRRSGAWMTRRFPSASVLCCYCLLEPQRLCLGERYASIL